MALNAAASSFIVPVHGEVEGAEQYQAEGFL
jgi:hypothetical protein